MGKKKIIFYMPSFEGGGVEKNVILIANFFCLKKFNVSIITASKKIKIKFSKKVKIVGPKLTHWDKRSRFFKYLICLNILFKEFLKDNNFSVLCFQGNISCIIFCKILGIDIVVRPNSSPVGWSNNFIKKQIFSSVLKLANKIVVNSIAFKTELNKQFNLKSFCIYNPLNIEEIKKLSKKKIRFNFFRNNTLNIISVGRLVEQKDHLTTLRAVNEVKKKVNLKILIVGDGNKKSELLDYISRNNLADTVKILNRTDNPYPYILKSDVVMLSSKFEGLPNVLLEALALKKFIISSNCSTGPGEILDNGKGGLLFKVGDYSGLSKKILYYKNNPTLCLIKKKHSLSRIARFNYFKNLNKYLNLFKNI